MVDARANERMQAVLADLVASGAELGLQLAAYRRGELVVDTWAGVADRASGRSVDGDTLFTVFSTSKGIAATCAHLLAERGQLDYDAPIARYWPEFAQNGKARATVRDALSHRVGVPRLPAGVTPAQLCDWEGMCAFLAAEAPGLGAGHAQRLPRLHLRLARRRAGAARRRPADRRPRAGRALPPARDAGAAPPANAGALSASPRLRVFRPRV
jgi:CubicO group peptidase (beta-lactamase class C family)